MLEMDMSKINLTNTSVIEPNQTIIMQSPIIEDIFDYNMDIYDESISQQERNLFLNVPNRKCCGKYFDDEDFIYAKMKLSEFETMETSDIPLENKLMSMNVENGLSVSSNTDNRLKDINSSIIMEIVIYINQHIQIYYTSLRHLRPLERIRYLPADLLYWIHNLTDSIRYLLDMNEIQFQPNENMPSDMFSELIYGLRLISCHTRLICNHFKAMGLILKNGEIEEKFLKKLMRLVNNMCVIMIYFQSVFS